MRRIGLILGVTALLVGAFVATGAGGEGGSGYQVRALFDTAAFIVKGEDVKISGVKVGKIRSLSVTPDNKAAVVLDITEPGYQDFRKDATCTIRPQSLIGEQYVECVPTQPRAEGEPLPPALAEIEDGPGAGQRLLPTEQTRTTVAIDLIGNINRLPVRQRLSLIINELGIGLAGRGEDLNAVIRRAAPALEETDKLLDLVADQNQVLAKLATDSDQIMRPLAREREHITGFAKRSSTVAAATVERQAAFRANFQKLPGFLRELTPTMRRLGQFSDATLPVATNLRVGARAINELIQRTGPFTRAATPALADLGDVGDVGIPALRRSLPIVRDLRAFGRQVVPVADDLEALLTSFRRNEGIERFMDTFFYTVQATNGFDQFGHFLRAGLLVNSCSEYAVTPAPECLSRFSPTSTASAAGTGDGTQSVAADDPVMQATAKVLNGAKPSDVLSAQQRREVQEQIDTNLGRAQQAAAVPAPAAPGEGATDDVMDFLFGADAADPKAGK